ncbi:hypothetical protein PBY51_000505 [Eleginops maclovinus]|uniref:Uncharacterized protein n=1 Tax=Eleginops maclovinus TaxID=56733 RepID=A0AAN7XFQ5_ELEMC|nr:hypothetical protein PBY51_000505 [Eleginops maclovinus]
MRAQGRCEKIEEKSESIPHGSVRSILPCLCAGDGFLQCSGHIITFTHFCPVSRSIGASPSWDRQQKSCRSALREIWTSQGPLCARDDQLLYPEALRKQKTKTTHS